MSMSSHADEQAITERVKRLYEQWPFPAPVSSSRPPALEGWCNYTYLYYHAMNEWRDSSGRFILDAGCGTGETLVPAFINNPGAHLVGWDLSLRSLDIAREKLDRIDARDVRLEVKDINLLPPPTQQFDLIFCTGVLHHLAEPLQGLRGLVGNLKTDGIMVLMLYADAPRAEIKKVQHILSLLAGDEPMSMKVQVARCFFNSLPTGHALLNPNRLGVDLTAYIARDEHLIDMFFHPREITYSIDTLFELLDAAELEHVRFFEEPAFDITTHLIDADLQRRALRLSRRQQYLLADLMDPHGDYKFIVRHKSEASFEKPDRKDRGLIPMLSPVAVRIDRDPLCPTSLVPRQSLIEITGFTHERYRLDETTRHVLDLCDGNRTIQDVVSRSGDREDTLALLAALEERGIVLFRRS